MTIAAAGTLLTTFLDPLHLTSIGAESIRVFLRKYNQYCKEITEREQPPTVIGSFSTKPIHPTNFKFCDSPEYLDSPMELGFLPSIAIYAELTEPILRKYLEFKAYESKESVITRSRSS